MFSVARLPCRIRPLIQIERVDSRLRALEARGELGLSQIGCPAGVNQEFAESLAGFVPHGAWPPEKSIEPLLG
jgi:hypothetical protein